MKLPERITLGWLDSLVDADLIVAESTLREKFFALEHKEKARHGDEYDMMRGSEELLAAWDRWSRTSNEAVRRGIRVRRKEAHAK